MHGEYIVAVLHDRKDFICICRGCNSDPEDAVRQVLYLLQNEEAYKKALSLRALKNTAAIEEYFSVDRSLGSIALKNKYHREFLRFQAESLNCSRIGDDGE